MREFLPCLYAFLACLAFAGIFEVKKPRILLLSSLTGAAGWAVYILAAPLGDVVLRSLVATLVVALLSEVLARVLKAPATIFLIVGIIPLVPGGGLYYTMYYLVNSDLDLFLREGLQTGACAGAIAVGVSMLSSLSRVISWHRQRRPQ